jgi:hypothetical protein
LSRMVMHIFIIICIMGGGLLDVKFNKGWWVGGENSSS